MKRWLGAETILAEIPDILHDESRSEGGIPSAFFLPEGVDDLKHVFTTAREKNCGVTFLGAQTGTTGGAVPSDGSIAVGFSAMKRIRATSLDTTTGLPILECDPGVMLETITAFLKNPHDGHYDVPGSEALAPGSFFYPPDPTETTAQLGGTVATNASGARSYRFGSTRSHIAYLDLMFASGETVRLKRTVNDGTTWDRRITTDQGRLIHVPPLPYSFTDVKNASGYYNRDDMQALDLFIGSEGTLAAIYGIGVYLSPAPVIMAGLSFFTSDEAAFDFADFLREEEHVVAIEFFDSGSLSLVERYRNRFPGEIPLFPIGAGSAVLWEYRETDEGGFEECSQRWETALLKCGSSFDKTWSGFDDADREKLRRFRHALPEAINGIIAQNKLSCEAIRKIGTDSAFPAGSFRSSYREMRKMIQEADLVHAAFGHLGNFHLHVNCIPSNAEELSRSLNLYDTMMSLAVREKGTVSAEHGIGKIKKKYLAQMYGNDSIDAMRRIKEVLDPKGLLNPGNLF